MEILITGGAGFIGTHLSRSLLQQGHSLTVLDNFLPQVHGEVSDVAADLRPHVRVLREDVAEIAAVKSAVESAQCIVHLAAETGTGQSMYAVARYHRTNLTGTALLFDLLLQGSAKKLERLVVASSRSIYGEGAYSCPQHGVVYPEPRSVEDKEKGFFDPLCPHCSGPCHYIPTPESAPFKPSSFYGLTKQVQEQMTLLFGGMLGVPSVALRYQNVFGPGQSLQNPYTGILAIFSNLARQQKPIRVFEDGMESRDFVFVEDVVAATSAAITRELSGSHSLNVGSNTATTVMQVAQSINDFYGGHSEVTITGAFRAGDIRHGLADLTKVKAALNYEPRWDFARGLTAFLEWANESNATDAGYERSLTEMRQRGLLRG